jgi:hypothetical protein
MKTETIYAFPNDIHESMNEWIQNIKNKFKRVLFVQKSYARNNCINTRNRFRDKTTSTLKLYLKKAVMYGPFHQKELRNGNVVAITIC